jgi:hypothetical protein
MDLTMRNDWDPYLKYPYTRLRDLGFPHTVQSLSKDDANAVLAQVALAAINSQTSPTAVTKQVLAGGPQNPLLTARQTRKKGVAPGDASGATPNREGEGIRISRQG